MTKDQKLALQALYDKWRPIVGDHKMVHKPVTFMHQIEREAFIGWVLNTVTPACLEEFLGYQFDQQPSGPGVATDDPPPSGD